MSNDSNQTNLGKPTRQPVRDVSHHSSTQNQPVQSAAHPVDIRRSADGQESNLGEYVKFGILAVILLGTPLVIALISPFIFGQIVPTILGSNLPTNTPAVPGDQVVEPETAGTAYPGLPTEPETGIGGEATPVLVTPAAPGPATDVLVHVVRSGETLDSIARLYGVTAADIAAANNIQDSSQIFSGTVLVIPPPDNPQ